MIALVFVKCRAQIETEAPKHERIVCSDAANTRNEDYGRTAYIIYETPDKAAKAVQKLNKMRIYQTPKPKGESSSALEPSRIRMTLMPRQLCDEARKQVLKRVGIVCLVVLSSRPSLWLLTMVGSRPCRRMDVPMEGSNINIHTFPLHLFTGKIGKKLSGDGRFFELKVFSYQPRSHTSVAPEFSAAERIAHDTNLSLKVAEALDTEFRRADSADGIKALLAEPEVSIFIPVRSCCKNSETKAAQHAKKNYVCSACQAIEFC